MELINRPRSSRALSADVSPVKSSRIHSSITHPKVSILLPSSAEISSKKTATLVCAANKGFLSDWSLSWKDRSSRSQESSAGLLEKDGLYSWSSSLTLSEQEWMESVSVSCKSGFLSRSAALLTHVSHGD
ncbi:hypothetical protein Q8A67_000028 [Cirrhinus molitorella]|uniref:Ig-like domain-containing protein n=1 Tax=Cirrhinus molitorella TaxID=172907 RepID=A0AA88TYE2_9TELE|nr:hypothetical protein Q8A67_000028 [Cirrhinus molitorella]